MYIYKIYEKICTYSCIITIEGYVQQMAKEANACYKLNQLVMPYAEVVVAVTNYSSCIFLRGVSKQGTSLVMKYHKYS